MGRGNHGVLIVACVATRRQVTFGGIETFEILALTLDGEPMSYQTQLWTPCVLPSNSLPIDPTRSDGDSHESLAIGRWKAMELRKALGLQAPDVWLFTASTIMRLPCLLYTSDAADE